MKIAYVANARFPSEKAQSDHVMAMCSAFAELGHEVALFVPDRRPVLADDPFSHYGKPKTFYFERIPCVDALKWTWLGPLGQWIQTYTFVQALRRRLREYQPDVAYSREPYLFLFGKLHGLNIWESHRVHDTFFARHAMKQMDAIVTLTTPSKKKFVAFGYPTDHVLVEPDAVDPTLFNDMPTRADARRSLGIADDEFLCLYTGKFLTMNMPKGLDESVPAVRQLRSEGRNVRLLAVGGTPAELTRYAPMAGDGVEFQGPVPQRELKRFYAAADLLMMPFPYTEHYAFYMSPLKLFEYLISNVPMVVTDLPSVRDIVSEETAFVAKPGDVPSLVECIREAMDQPAKAKMIAAAARALADRYTWVERTRRIVAWLGGLKP